MARQVKFWMGSYGELIVKCTNSGKKTELTNEREIERFLDQHYMGIDDCTGVHYGEDVFGYLD